MTLTAGYTPHMPKQTTAERFWSRVDWTPTCWPWLGGLHSKDPKRGHYGCFYLGRAPYRAHRVAWWLTYGYWPLDILRHDCDNGMCVRPSHLREGSVLDNNEDKTARGRNWSILTEQQVREIHAAATSGEMHKSIAIRFRTTPENVHYIATGQSWRQLGLQPQWRTAHRTSVDT